ncbi:MAG TPA: cyclic nucleotide-binding domain-containing protein [Deltaproteobacteria bacterium]|nr:cyclic nucleotide-binding domain-containing protein [Deltaproteobacteria bacterium]
MDHRQYPEENRLLLDIAKGLPLFSSFDDDALKALTCYCRLRKYGDGSPIFNQGEYDNRIFFLISGAVRVFRDGVIISVLRRSGDVFGEMSLLDGRPRSATVVAEGETRCLVLDASCLDTLPELCRDNFRYILHRVFTTVLSQRLRATTEELLSARREIERLKFENRHLAVSDPVPY